MLDRDLDDLLEKLTDKINSLTDRVDELERLEFKNTDESEDEMSKSVQVQLTVTNGAYSIGDVVGGLITLPDAVWIEGGHSVINSVKLAGVVAIPYELWFFNANIATPAVDNAAFALAAADQEKFLGELDIASTDYRSAQNSFNNATVRQVGLQIQAAEGTKIIYAYLKATAVTSPGTTELILTVDFEYIS